MPADLPTPPDDIALVLAGGADPFADLDAVALDDAPLAALDRILTDGSVIAPAQFEQRLLRLGAESDARRRANVLLPWIVSVLGHLAVLAISLAVTWTVVQLRATEAPVLIVSDFTQPTYRDTVTAEGSDTGTAPLSERERELALPPLPATASSVPGSGMSMAPSAPNVSGIDWTPPAGRAITFAGVRASNARRVAYVVDASGSMVGTLPIVIDELARSLRALSADQTFAVLFFQRNESLAAPPSDRLIPATPETIDRAMRWIRSRIGAAGRSNPMKALEGALRMRPDVIFLLSPGITGAGEFEIAPEELLRQLDAMNPRDSSGRRRTSIQCVQFLEPDPLDTLRRISERHGGQNAYRFLSRAELTERK